MNTLFNDVGYDLATRNADVPGGTSLVFFNPTGGTAAGHTVPAWTSSWIYTGSEKVVYDGRLWQAKWWTRNQTPGDPYGPWQLVRVCPAP